MLDDAIASQVRAFFAHHPVLSKYAGELCVALTGSYAVDLGGPGADVDAKVLCPAPLYERIKAELIAAGRIGATEEPEEEFTAIVGDYTLESLAAVWQRVADYHDMTALFIYGNLVYLDGDRTLLEPLVSYCRHLPPAVLKQAIEQEEASMGQALYAFLRSFQNADRVARTLGRAGMVRSAMRLTFLADGVAPPYDKHLFRLLPRVARGQQVAERVRDFLADQPAMVEEARYAAVGAAPDWHGMYAAAEATPACLFRRTVRQLLAYNPAGSV